MRFEVTASEPNKCYLSISGRRSYYTIVPLTYKRRSFSKSHDPNGLIDKNPGRNATWLLYFSWLNTKTVWWKDTLCSWPVQCELWIHLKNVPRSITIWVFFGMIEFVLLHLARSSKFILKSGTHWHGNTLIGSEEGGPIWLKSSESWDVHITSTVTNPLYFKLMGQ